MGEMTSHLKSITNPKYITQFFVDHEPHMLKELGIFRNLTLTNNLVEADKAILKAKAEVSEDYMQGKLSAYLFTKYNQKYIND